MQGSWYMYRKIDNKKSNEINIRSESEFAEKQGYIGNESNFQNDLLQNISNEANNSQIIDGMGENEPYSNGSDSGISRDEGKQLLKSLDRIPDNEKDQAGLIENLDLIGAENQHGGIENLDQIGDPDLFNNSSDMKSTAAQKRPGWKKGAKSKNGANIKNPAVNNEDLAMAGEDMEPIAGWNFEPEMFPQWQRQSGFKRFVSKLAYYSGKTVGKVSHQAR